MQLTNCELSLSLILSLITPAASRLTHPAFYSSWKLQLFAQSTHTMSDCRKSGSLGMNRTMYCKSIKWIESVNTGPHCCWGWDPGPLHTPHQIRGPELTSNFLSTWRGVQPELEIVRSAVLLMIRSLRMQILRRRYYPSLFHWIFIPSSFHAHHWADLNTLWWWWLWCGGNVGGCWPIKFVINNYARAGRG